MLRFAPSPTRDMHLGDLRVALFNHLVSKQRNEDLIIRIEDIDVSKNIEGKDKDILEILNLFSIDYTQVLHQSNNLKYHQQIAMQFLVNNKAFNCFCSDAALEQDREKLEAEGKPYSYSGFCENLHDETTLTCEAPFVVRLKKPEKDISFKDTIQGELSYEPDEVDSFVILDHSKKPTYDFACGIDDMISNIDVVIRSEDFINNTPKQIHVRGSINYDKEIEYIHVPNLENADISVQSLIDDGFLPVAIANYLVMLGFNTPKEIFSLEEATEWFDISTISKDKISFDIEKLKEINKEHIKDVENLRLSKILGYADDDIGALGKVYLEEENTIKGIKVKIDSIFCEKEELEDYEVEFNSIKNCLTSAPFMNELDALIEYISKKTNFEGDKLLKPLRYILTGKIDGPDLNKIYPLIRNYLGEIV